MRGQIRIADDFDTPLPDDLLGDFAGNWLVATDGILKNYAELAQVFA